MKTLVLGALALFALSGVARARSAAPPTDPTAASRAAASALPPVDYADPAAWLCRPGARPNACDVDLTATVVGADGSLTVQPFKADPAAPIDCFYVYPTVSTDPGVLATMKIEPAETTVIAQQFARFGAKCRLFAPVYRQFTLTALAAAMYGHPLPGSTPRPTTPYDDVRDAWNWYLKTENHGRGVVLIGHSQGSGLLTELIRNEIDGKAEQGRLVSAILMGTHLAVPKGAEVGGDFKSVPLCRATGQTGCVIAYASFRDTSPPPAGSGFGPPRAAGGDLITACVNPANLAGGAGPLESYLAAGNTTIAVGAARPPPPWVKGKTVNTPFVTTPGLLTARCAATPTMGYLAVHVNADPASPRVSDIVGDVVLGGQVQTDWGLHLIDANLAMGNLVTIVGDEARAWAARRR